MVKTIAGLCTNADCNAVFYGSDAPNFCPNCGKKVIAACPACGKKVGAFSTHIVKFCEGCGKPLKS